MTDEKLLRRFNERWRVDDSHSLRGEPCWRRIGYIDKGYGRIKSAGRKALRAHRVGYELYVGPIPEGLVLDHLCRNKWCVNPAHLEPVTSAENLRRGIPAGGRGLRTHCPKGHEYTERNTYITPEGWRACRECGRQSHRARYARQARQAPSLSATVEFANRSPHR